MVAGLGQTFREKVLKGDDDTAADRLELSYAQMGNSGFDSCPTYDFRFYTTDLEVAGIGGAIQCVQEILKERNQ